MSDPTRRRGPTPRWVKVSGGVIVAIIVVVVVMIHLGHGPWHAMPAVSAPAATP